MFLIRSRRTAVVMLALIAVAATARAGFHYCALQQQVVNSNHTCGRCALTNLDLPVTLPSGEVVWFDVYAQCDLYTADPGACYRAPMGGTTTPTCDINVTSGCGTGVDYTISSTCDFVMMDDINEYIPTGWPHLDPDTDPCSGSKVTVTQGSTSGVDCTNAFPPTFYFN